MRVFHHLEFFHHVAGYPVGVSISDFKNYCPLLTSYYTIKLVDFFLFKYTGIYRYLPVFGIGVLGITGITVFEKVCIFAIPTEDLPQKALFRAKPNGRRNQGRLKSRWVDGVNSDSLALEVRDWTHCTQDRQSWKGLL
jgi:hypothetical protein